MISLATKKEVKKKKCTACHEELKLTDFYISKSPLFSLDQRVPICKKCVINNSVNKETGEIDELALNKTLRQIDKPYYKDSIESAKNQFKKENSYIEDDKISFYGMELLQLYFKNIAMRQTINKSYADSEKEGFVYTGSNTIVSEKKRIAKKYSDINSALELKKSSEDEEDSINVKWTKKDKQNMKYVISTIGYDPFDDVSLQDSDKKYCFNILAGYCDTDGISEDGHKMQSVIEITMLYCQCKKITEAMNVELSQNTVDDAKISKLTSSKSSLLSSIATIAKDNNIASNYNKNSKQGQSSLTSKMKEMSENGFTEIEVNLFDIKTSEAFKQIDKISNDNIANQLTLDSNEYTDIIKEQREMIQKYDSEIDILKEENRILKNKIIDLESKR